MNTPTTPTDTARLTLDAMAANLDQLRTALADAYGRAGAALTQAGTSVAAAEHRATIAEERAAAWKRLMERRTTTLRKRAQEAEAATAEAREATAVEEERTARHSQWLAETAAACDAPDWPRLADTVAELAARTEQAEQDAERFKADHLAACTTIADMHEAATGRTGMGPIRGVVEDVADVRARAEKAEKRGDHWKRVAQEIEADRERLLATKYDAERTAATLQRVRDAESLADALAAVAEHDGLPPEAARAAANIAAAAEQPAAIDAERERDHALRLAAAEHSKREAQRDAERATQTLLRVKHASTAADAWTVIGAHFHMPATEAGRGARRWRSAAETIAERHAQRAEADVQEIAKQLRAVEEEHGLTCEQFNEAAAARDRFEAAWQNARQRAQHATHRAEMVSARAERNRQSRNRWTRQALDAADTIKRVRALLDTHFGPLDPASVRAALDTPTER
ncbi:hypothetical protein [Streptomyces sp. NPDC096323]|uniref:hypothetical protein n=1 Tax=Streptomyces sp. NPDC096323 TaxID=3155822 RepID=UPI0033211092